MPTLNDRLLVAHAQGDKTALVALYREAADETTDLDAACFYLTQAYVFALDLGHPDTAVLYARLATHGRV